MKKILLAVLFLTGVAAFSAYASPGDTTWVQAHNRWLPTNGNYDSSVVFPDGSLSYRKIYMIFTLGKYQCPGNPQYCGDWDYMAQTYVMTPTGDTIELGRLITPYANASYPRTPWGWTERYIFDITDYYPVLKNSAIIRLRYSGSTGGFTTNIKFAFIEGTTERNVTGVVAPWRGDFAFGSSANPIENRAIPKTYTAPQNTQSAELKFTVTGHRSDNNGCSEFCSKYYQVLLNGNIINQTNIWRNDCGLNHMYPQSGTWVYDRSNWCPGDLVKVYNHQLPGVTGGNSYTVDVDFEPYTTTATAPPYYAIGSAVVYYAGFNKSVDASLEDIIAPTNFEGHFRQNPLAGKPVIRVRNSGSTTITSLKIEYGMTGNLTQYTWSGSLASLQEAEIELPEPPGLRNAMGANNQFNATILQANNQIDDDATNNALQSTFTAAPKWSNKLIIKLKTNASASSGVSETDWKIYDPSGNIVAQRTGNSVNTQYADTIWLPGNYYKLVVSDLGCDGISWWANPNAGIGTFQVVPLAGIVPYPLNGYFSGDFGCGFTQSFTVDAVAGINNIHGVAASINVFPNPATSQLSVELGGINKVSGTLIVTDVMGKIVVEQQCNNQITTLNTTGLANGLYKVIFINAANEKLQTNFLIAR